MNAVWKCAGCEHLPHGGVCLGGTGAVCRCDGQPECDVVCQHGTAADVHCCGCHSGFLFWEKCACFATGSDLIVAERQRQIAAKGYTPEHDDTHEGAELLQAAAWYLDNGSEYDFGLTLPPWPWEQAAWKPSDDRVRQLSKAGALIAAEIDRIIRQRRTRCGAEKAIEGGPAECQLETGHDGPHLSGGLAWE